ncbi:MAG TPA: TrmH family RNA methyltransferase, partial [Actinomycetota bacterium]|nr:TrmH family RNA methyltransferase [Actinomycetota bacterium]
MAGGVVSGKRAVLEALRAGEATEVLIAKGTKESTGMREVLDAARGAHVRVRPSERSALDALASDHRGVVARLGERPPPSLSERDLSMFTWFPDAIAVVLDGVEDPQNLGAAARSVEASGGQMLITRTHRSAPVTDAAIRASAGALLHLPHARVANLVRAIGRLQEEGFTVIGLDESATCSIYDEPCPGGR